MKEKVIIYNKRFEVICEITMASEDWDIPCLIDKLSKEQLKKVKKAFIDFHNDYVHYDDDKFSMRDIEDDNVFEDCLIDYYCDFCDDDDCFIKTETIEEVEEKKSSMTIRQLYELAKKNNSLDIPINFSHYCNDDWYSLIDEPLTENEIEFTGNVVDIVY
jgi:hypothetical protein